jgi:beta-N-acetylhexosaminidase
VTSGEISQQALDSSVLKVLQAKASLGLHKAREVDPEKLSGIIGSPQDLATGQQVADDAVTLVRDNGSLLPLKHSGTVESGAAYNNREAVTHLAVVIFSEDMRTEGGRSLERQIRMRVPGAKVIYVDQRNADGMGEQVLDAVNQATAVVAAVYMVPTPGAKVKGTGVAGDSSASLLEKILQTAAAKTEVIAVGNPYLAADFPDVQNYVCTFSNAAVSEVAVVKALFGEIPIHGRLPVSIPNVAARGAGIDRPISGAH